MLSVLHLGHRLHRITVFGDPRQTPTEAFIQQGFDKGYTILNSASLSDAERRESVSRAPSANSLANRRIALFSALGPYASGAKPSNLNCLRRISFTNYNPLPV